MPLVPAKCTQCGANLDVDSSLETAVCPNCTTKFITERAINNFNTTNVTNIDTVNAEVVNVESSDSVSNLSRTAETLMNFGEWNKAREIYLQITEKYPYDWRGWYGLLQTNTQKFQLYFDRYEEYHALVGIYERLITVSDESTPDMVSVKSYLEVVYGKVEVALSKRYEQEGQILRNGIVNERAQMKDDIPLEVKDEKMFGIKATKVVWVIWIAIAGLFSLVGGIGTAISGDDLDINFGFLRFENMDYFWDVTLFISVFMLILQVIVSCVLCVIGVLGLSAQKYGKQKKLTAFKFITKGSIVTASLHLIFCFVVLFIVAVMDPGFFFTYSGTYRYIQTILFHSRATETGACWIALLLIIIYSVVNYVLIAAPLLAAERVGDKKRSAIQINIHHKQELIRLTQLKETLPKRYEEEFLKLKMLRAKHL